MRYFIINAKKYQKITQFRTYRTMKSQLKLTESHRAIIAKCMKHAGYPAALAKEVGVSRVLFYYLQREDKTLGWGTWLEIISYARRSGVVGPYFDPITLQEPPLNYDLDKEVSEAAWMLQRIPLGERSRIVTEIAAAYGKAVARERDGEAQLA